MGILLLIYIFSLIDFDHNTKIDKFAAYIAGEKGDNLHKQEMDDLWEHYIKHNLNEVQKWQKQEIEEQYEIGCKVFYPFSGPDILHVMNFFPNCAKYYMFGLEAPGTNLKNFRLTKEELVNLRKGIYSIFQRSFFVTREMWQDFSQKNYGVILPIMVLLKRMGYTIIGLDNVYINNIGKITKVKQSDNISGIRIKTINKDSLFIKEVYYFKTNLNNNNKVIPKFLYNQNEIITYLKAAQYTLFGYDFTNLRNAIISQSNFILQDDTGIPFMYFNNVDWIIELFGRYVGPYGESFKNYIQKDLLDYNMLHPFKPLPFKLGYGYKRRPESFLMKITKKQ